MAGLGQSFFPPMSAGGLPQNAQTPQAFSPYMQPQLMTTQRASFGAQIPQNPQQGLTSSQQELLQLRAQVAQMQMQSTMQGQVQPSTATPTPIAPVQQASSAKASTELRSDVPQMERDSLNADLSRFSLNVGALETGGVFSIQEILSFTAYASSSSRDLDAYQWAALLEGHSVPLAASMTMVLLASTSSVVQRFVRLNSTKGVQEDLKRVLPLIQAAQKDFPKVKEIAGTDAKSMRNSSISASCGTAANLLGPPWGSVLVDPCRFEVSFGWDFLKYNVSFSWDFLRYDVLLSGPSCTRDPLVLLSSPEPVSQALIFPPLNE
ncbi:unnamed protein product [Symbiodinium natans]|uniref:Uncharacterized protein n=1 Tax=Symbiodinium natans TaxID=878477 RepID=A0A812TC76_9DINO|nr:unnamed protein product [Symbiodinium natans]